MNEKMIEYTVIYERGQTNWGAYVPDLPGCIAVAETLAEVQQMIVESIEFHIEGLIELGLPIPQPTSIAQEVEVLI